MCKGNVLLIKIKLALRSNDVFNISGVGENHDHHCIDHNHDQNNDCWPANIHDDKNWSCCNDHNNIGWRSHNDNYNHASHDYNYNIYNHYNHANNYNFNIYNDCIAVNNYNGRSCSAVNYNDNDNSQGYEHHNCIHDRVNNIDHNK